ncbi:MAG: S-layer homology domain-containing protein, partial [Clostridia bacterium]|nr:S-layer homology domain-containing protein [Clostridia bacterium]
MTIMKKALCLILAFCMLSIPVSFAEETDTLTSSAAATEEASTEFSDIDYSTPTGISIEALVEKNIITGFPDGTYKAEQTLTRAEFAKIIVCFLGSSTESNQDSGFPDVDNVGGSAHWAKAYIKIAKDMKIIDGFPDGTFAPDAPVTYEQAVKMIMCALGFTNLSYPDGYIQLAMQKKLFVNSTHTSGQSAAITRGTTAIFIYNALSITPNNKTTDNTNATFTGVSFGSGGGSGSGGG